jgi:hypothetical protein
MIWINEAQQVLGLQATSSVDENDDGSFFIVRLFQSIKKQRRKHFIR